MFYLQIANVQMAGGVHSPCHQPLVLFQSQSSISYFSLVQSTGLLWSLSAKVENYQCCNMNSYPSSMRQRAPNNLRFGCYLLRTRYSYIPFPTPPAVPSPLCHFFLKINAVCIQTIVAPFLVSVPSVLALCDILWPDFLSHFTTLGLVYVREKNWLVML